MAETTAIEWAHSTFNPWRGCTKVSTGCANCYAERETTRYGLDFWGKDKARPRTSAKYWNQPHKWNAAAQAAGERRRVFCASFADVGEDRPDLVEARRDLEILIERTPMLDWLLLTKRPENLVRLFARWNGAGGWPPNAWAGTSAEDQATAESRIPDLVKVPAAVRFLSAEPLVGPVNLGHVAGLYANSLHWVIAGGESGPGARPTHLPWVQGLRDQCQRAGVPFLFKQWGEFIPAEEYRPHMGQGSEIVVDEGPVRRGFIRVGKHAAGRRLEGEIWDQFPEAPHAN